MGRKWRETYPGSGEYEEISEEQQRAEALAPILEPIAYVLGFPWTFFAKELGGGCLSSLFELVAMAQIILGGTFLFGYIIISLAG